MGNSAALLGGIAAAAPGIAQGVNQAIPAIQGYIGAGQTDAAVPQIQQQSGDALDAMVAGMPNAGASPVPAGAIAPMPGATPAGVGFGQTAAPNATGAIGGALGSVTGMERGGLVPPTPNIQKRGFGTATQNPLHRAANIGALGSGVVPASTDGQLLTFDQGGVVPGGNSMSTSPDFQQAQTPQVPMTGPAAGFVQGFGSGQAIGRNLLNAWNEHNARQDAAKYADAADSYNPGGPSTPPPSTNPTPIGQLQDHVEQFFSHLKSLTLGDNGAPNHAQGVPNPATQPIPGSGPQPAQAIPAGTPPTAQAATQGGAPPPPTPGAPPPAGGPGGPPAVMGGNPSSPAPGQPNPTPPDPAQVQKGQQAGATAAAVQQGAQQSQQDQAQGQPNANNAPHSLTTDDYDNLQHLKMRAVHSAILAGKDPNTVYNSMNALETAHFQSQITRYMSNAQAALQHGDMDEVKKSLANANYYLPNGQDINMKTATQADIDAASKDPQYAGQPPPFKVGDLMVQSPTYGISGHQGPEWQPVTMQTLQLEGQNLLDPTKVAGIISGTYTAQSENRLRQQQGAADVTNANARWVQANGIKDWRESQAAFTAASTATKLKLMGSEAQLDKAKALKLLQDNADATGKGPKVTAGAVQTASKAAGQAAQSAMLGPQTVINDPVTGQHISHDTTKVDPNYAGFSASQQNDVLGLAQGIAAANVGSVSAQDAAGMAAQIVRFQAQGESATHKEADGKTYKNYVYDGKSDTGHLWVPSGGGKGNWRVFRGTPNIASAEPGVDVSGGGGDSSGSADTGSPDSGAGGTSNDDIS